MKEQDPRPWFVDGWAFARRFVMPAAPLPWWVRVVAVVGVVWAVVELCRG